VVGGVRDLETEDGMIPSSLLLPKQKNGACPIHNRLNAEVENAYMGLDVVDHVSLRLNKNCHVHEYLKHTKNKGMV
jgi:hypothetical protein